MLIDWLIFQGIRLKYYDPEFDIILYRLRVSILLAGTI